MLHAAVDIAPVEGGRLVTVDPAPARSMPGVRQVVELENAVAVVADSYWRARKALAALNPVYDDAGHGEVSSATIFAAFDEALGDAPEMPAEAAQVVTADYRVPFLAHATMEPMACTVRVDGDRAEVWAGTQDPLNARSAAANALGFDTSQVQFTNLMLGGGYGRRLPFCFDYVDLAARIAQAMSPAPVKLVWSRENDIQHDYYRPAAMCRYAGALAADGRPLAVGAHYAGGGDRESLFMPYAIPDRRFDARGASHHIREGAWRSVLNSQHGFFKESFIDELAHAAGRDPYEYRRLLMDDHPRFRAALDRAAEMAGWGRPLPEGEGRGIAIAESFGSIVAQAAHVAVSPEGGLRVRHVWAAVDCGDVVNPDSAAAQIEGGVVFGLSAALVGEITIDGGRVAESNFHDHRMIRMADAPDVQVAFIRSGARPGGLGEPGVPPVAPAVTNAVYAATGDPGPGPADQEHEAGARVGTRTAGGAPAGWGGCLSKSGSRPRRPRPSKVTTLPAGSGLRPQPPTNASAGLVAPQRIARVVRPHHVPEPPRHAQANPGEQQEQQVVLDGRPLRGPSEVHQAPEAGGDGGHERQGYQPRGNARRLDPAAQDQAVALFDAGRLTFTHGSVRLRRVDFAAPSQTELAGHVVEVGGHQVEVGIRRQIALDAGGELRRPGHVAGPEPEPGRRPQVTLVGGDHHALLGLEAPAGRPR